MKLRPIFASILLAVCALVAPPSTAQAQNTTPVAPATTFVGTHYEGIVSSLDDSEQTGTITTRFGLKTLPFKVTAETKIWTTQPMPARNLTEGAKVMVIGKEENKTGDTVTPYVIDVLPDLPQADNSQPPIAKGVGVILMGTLTAIGDDYTLSDRSGRIITLKVKGNRLVIGQTLPATFQDIDEGRAVKLDGVFDGQSFVLSRVVIQPGGTRRGQAKVTDKLPGLAAAGETALAATAIVKPPDQPPAAGTPAPAPSAAPTPNPAPAPKFNDGDFGIYDLF